MTEIRRYRPGDSEAVQSLNERALRAAGTDPADVPDADDVADVEGSYLDPGGEFLVADRDGEVVGMGGLLVEDREAELFRMRVDPDCQREGIGRRLLAALEDAARERGATTILAETAQRQTAAVSFYPDNGYERVGTASRGEYTLLYYEKEL